MDYTVLARRFRPQAFDEIVGQQHVAQALRNAIASDRVAHAYLFTGARGVGKTSTARILAKSLNCPNAANGNPCNQCDVCQAISEGNDVDVLEIDGASNRQIDDIRALRSNVGVRSLRSRYKIYLIDEVHMLTKEAFNALLKTLEEPPANVKFIFCTTDPQKLPETILSRCQRFDFGTIATASISQRLREIADSEGVRVDPAAVELVSRRAAGSMRDSQSLFDQLLAFGGKEIGIEAVHRLLGTAPDDRLIGLAAALIDKRGGDALRLLDACLSEGVQLTELTDQLVSYLRDLMVLAAGARDMPLQSVADDRRAALDAQAKAWGLNGILAALQIVSEAKLRMKGAISNRPLAELALVRISLLEDLENLSQIVQALKSSKPSPTVKPELPKLVAGKRMIPADVRTEVESLKSPSPPANDPSPEASPVPTVSLEEGRESEVLSQLIAVASDPQISGIQKATSLAILGPNQVVVVFPKRYHWVVNSLDRPDPLGRLERLLQAVTGRPVGIKFRVEEAGSAEPVPTDVRSAAATNEMEKDPMVQKIMNVFGAQIVRVESGTPESAEAAGGQDAE